MGSEARPPPFSGDGSRRSGARTSPPTSAAASGSRGGAATPGLGIFHACMCAGPRARARAHAALDATPAEEKEEEDEREQARSRWHSERGAQRQACFPVVHRCATGGERRNLGGAPSRQQDPVAVKGAPVRSSSKWPKCGNVANRGARKPRTQLERTEGEEKAASRWQCAG